MKRIILFRHPECAKCAKIARIHQLFDWFHHVDCSTETPKTGPLQIGEIVVEDVKTGEISQGIAAVRRIFREIPAYWLLLPLLWLPPIARKVDKEVRGCEDGACDLPTVPRAANPRK